jgi:uncharacterized protein
MSPAFVDEAVTFDCAGERLVGVVSRPQGRGAAVGAVIVVGGPQYRAGSHRQFVQWSRALAAAGTPTLRFDARGMGDSSGELRPFTALTDDIGAAIDALRAACPQVERVVLCGLCDGASAALLYLQERRDLRVAGLVLLNPWTRSEQTQARTLVKHYYLQRLASRAFWVKLLRGQVALKAVRDLAGRLSEARGARRPDAQRYQDRMLAGLQALPGPVLLALCGEDYTAKEFLEQVAADAAWSAALRRPQVKRLDLPGADHTLSNAEHRRRFEAACLAWFAAIEPRAETAAA